MRLKHRISDSLSQNKIESSSLPAGIHSFLTVRSFRVSPRFELLIVGDLDVRKGMMSDEAYVYLQPLIPKYAFFFTKD